MDYVKEPNESNYGISSAQRNLRRSEHAGKGVKAGGWEGQNFIPGPDAVAFTLRLRPLGGALKTGN